MSDAPDTARLFIALWPTPGVRHALRDWRDLWTWPKGAAPVRTEQLHMTLHFLGSLPAGRLPELAQGLRVPFHPFDLRLSEPKVWSHGVAVLGPRTVPKRLLELHAELGEALLRLELPVEARQYKPHVTLARRAAAAEPPAYGPVLRWRVGGYALMQSRDGAYTVVERYS